MGKVWVIREARLGVTLGYIRIWASSFCSGPTGRLVGSLGTLITGEEHSGSSPPGPQHSMNKCDSGNLLLKELLGEDLSLNHPEEEEWTSLHQCDLSPNYRTALPV